MPQLSSSARPAVKKSKGLQRIITPEEVLRLMPDGLRYLFLDEIVEVDESHIVARYRFREDEFFYQGHFPDRAVTPGTVLLEAMCQCGVTAHSYFFLASELGMEAAKRYRVLFTSSQAEFFTLIGPGTVINMHSELLAWRARRIHARVKLFCDENTLVAESVLAGMSVSWHAQDAAKNSFSGASVSAALEKDVQL